MNRTAGHLCALITILIWGTTFIATKVLLVTFSPTDIILIRFLIGYLTLIVLCPRAIRPLPAKQEGWFVLTGLTGITSYYLLENVALKLTMAANVGILLATVPFFTVLSGFLFRRSSTRVNRWFFIGFAFAMTGIVLISLNGQRFHLNPLGDFLAILAAADWALYSLCLSHIEGYGYSNLANTRRIFFWGIVLLLPFLLLQGVRLSPRQFNRTSVLLFLFLGILACAICYLLWNRAQSILGPVTTNLYLYLEPVVTLIASAIVLHEPMTALSLLGTGLILSGLALSGHP